MSCQKPPHSHGQKLKFFIHFSSFHYTSLTRKLQLSFFQLFCTLFSALLYLKGSDAGVFLHNTATSNHPALSKHVAHRVWHSPKHVSERVLWGMSCQKPPHS